MVTFEIAISDKLELLRARADFHEPLPRAFYGGTNEFWGGPGDKDYYGAWGDVAAGGPNADSGGTDREVVESDIWRIAGDRLYYFNQYRGLQIVDIHEPDNARVIGEYSLPAAGEDMYMLDTNHVVLLASSGCSYPSESQVLILSVSNDIPVLLKSLALSGSLQESRMVGTALYVACQTYQTIATNNGTIWEWGSSVSSFDLSNPAAPVQREPLWFPGYGNVVTATDTFLFVSVYDISYWQRSVVYLVDITSPDARMAAYATIRPQGNILDKFKINYHGSTLTLISEDSSRTNGAPLITRLETYHVPDPRTVPPFSTLKLGELELGRGERLHATRFDGDKVYVVTFFQIDPLWIVDLSDAANPSIAGELQVPGWSTYIQPLGMRLLTVGVETNRVAVSLFDVQDPAKPFLASRVLLGNSYSWSEANNDEKAFAVLEDEGLVLVPYSGDTTNGWATRVQLIDLTSSNLVARGIVEHHFQPRRSAMHRDRILSLSGLELLSVDAANRDLPEVKGVTPLAWSVDRIFVQGDYVLQLSGGEYWWGPQPGVAIHVGMATDPDQLLNSVSLGQTRLSGATLRGGLLYVAQTEDVERTNEIVKTRFILSVFDARSLPALPLVGKTEAMVDQSPWGWASWSPAWCGTNVLVWAGGGYGWWGPWLGYGLTDGLWWRGWTRGDTGGGHLVAFTVDDPGKPVFASEVNLITNAWWSFSLPEVHDTLLYVSHEGSEPVPDVTNRWVQRYYLDVVDYADPVSPTIRKPVSVPGTLLGLSHEGEMLYTTGYTSTNGTYWTEVFDAVAYDGVQAHLVASMQLPSDWPHPVMVSGTNILLGRPHYTSGTDASVYALENWVLNEDGKFARTASVPLSAPVTTLWAQDCLVAAQEDYGAVSVFDISNPAKFVPLSRIVSPGCIGFNLSRSAGTLGQGLWIPLGNYGVSWQLFGP
jgi:hypothetical protein